ncbi:hypothetical protein ASF30_11045 [Leifsonia sp. Leaf264]|nr:hypothetical protein ASF30_11045 [Leifsonia sp. Leaf264]
MDELTERIASALAQHFPTRGMSVSMGVTCECGYWTGAEPEAGKRPLPWGRDQLGLHRARIIRELLGLPTEYEYGVASLDLDGGIYIVDHATTTADVPVLLRWALEDIADQDHLSDAVVVRRIAQGEWERHGATAV